MISSSSTRRDFSLRLASVFSAWGIAGTDLGFSGSADRHRVAGDERISRTSETIHQENVFSASRKQVYDALMDAKQFTKVTAFSSVPKAPPAEISPDIGGPFSCFGGHNVGRHVELVPDERIVQAWRVVDWDAGIYSIARFERKNKGPKPGWFLTTSAFRTARRNISRQAGNLIIGSRYRSTLRRGKAAGTVTFTSAARPPHGGVHRRRAPRK